MNLLELNLSSKHFTQFYRFRMNHETLIKLAEIMHSQEQTLYRSSPQPH